MVPISHPPSSAAFTPVLAFQRRQREHQRRVEDVAADRCSPVRRPPTDSSGPEAESSRRETARAVQRDVRGRPRQRVGRLELRGTPAADHLGLHRVVHRVPVVLPEGDRPVAEGVAERPQRSVRGIRDHELATVVDAVVVDVARLRSGRCRRCSAGPRPCCRCSQSPTSCSCRSHAGRRGSTASCCGVLDDCSLPALGAPSELPNEQPSQFGELRVERCGCR